MGDFLKIEVILYHMVVNFMTLMWIVINILYSILPKNLAGFLEDTHVQGVFKGATGIVLGVFLLIQKGYDILSKRRKYKGEAETKAIYDAHYLAGLRLMEHRLYVKAIIEFETALNLNYDNDKANAKIAKCKHLQDHDE